MNNRPIQKSLLRAAALGLLLWGTGAFPENGWAVGRTPTSTAVVPFKSSGSGVSSDGNSQKKSQDSRWQRTKQGALKNIQKIAPTQGMKDSLEQKRRALSAKRHGDDGAHYDAKRAMEASKKNKERGMEASNKNKERGMEASNKNKEPGTAKSTGSSADYLTLGLPFGSSQEDIRKAYLKLSLKNHPDKNPDNPEASEKMKEITAAYNRLKNVK